MGINYLIPKSNNNNSGSWELIAETEATELKNDELILNNLDIDKYNEMFLVFTPKNNSDSRGASPYTHNNARISINSTTLTFRGSKHLTHNSAMFKIDDKYTFKCIYHDANPPYDLYSSPLNMHIYKIGKIYVFNVIDYQEQSQQKGPIYNLYCTSNISTFDSIKINMQQKKQHEQASPMLAKGSKIQLYGIK